MLQNNLIKELKRRNVFKVATAYAIVGWLIIQIVVAVNAPLNLPDWFDTAVIITVIIGFPIALIVAWAFELTPEGIKKTDNVSKEQSIVRETGQKLNRLIITALVVLIAFLLVERIFFAGEYGTEAEAAPAITTADSTADRSVAVLPFADFSPDKDQEWFADGLAEEILNSLVKTPDLKVAARTSSFKYKGTNEEIPVIAKALGVQHVLEGSIRWTPERLRVTAQLIRASDGFHVWSNTYDRSPDDAISIQEELALSIAKALNTAMDTAALKDMIRVGTTSIAAYNLYLEGISGNNGDMEVFMNSIKFLDQAREIDPEFAEAHYAAARYWANNLSITSTTVVYRDTDFNKILDNFHESIRAAINTSESELDILKYRTIESEVNLRWREAEKLYDEYLALRPNDFRMIESYIRLLSILREHEKAYKYLQVLEREQGDVIDTRLDLINFYYRTLNKEKADRLAELMLKENSTNIMAMYQVQRSLLWSGKVALAAQAAANYETYAPETDSDLLLTVRMRQLCGEGKRKEAEKLYEEILAMDWDITKIWHIHMAMGENEKAEEILRELDNPDLIRQFSFFLFYPQFDPRPYPNLMKQVERERVQHIEPVPMPFALPAEAGI